MPARRQQSPARQLLASPPTRRSQKLFTTAYDLARSMGWTYLGCGRHRATFAIDEQWVIKIPLGVEGETANISEYEQYHEARPRTVPHVAWCMIDEWAGVVVSIMERVQRPQSAFVWDDIYNDPHLRWVSSVDCHQVGYTSTGVLVAYDYSHN